jgi:hypothetical protein
MGMATPNGVCPHGGSVRGHMHLCPLTVVLDAAVALFATAGGGRRWGWKASDSVANRSAYRLRLSSRGTAALAATRCARTSATSGARRDGKWSK